MGLEEGRWARTTIIADDDAETGAIGLTETVHNQFTKDLLIQHLIQ